MDSLKDLLSQDKKYANKLLDKHKYISQEFQDYGYRLAVKLEDLKRVSMYIKIAKERERALVESAFSFAIDYPNAKNRSRLFMWKLKQLEAKTTERREKIDKEG